MNGDQRYRGHISLCEIDLPGQKRISEGKVLIIGAGGLGSPACLYLAAAGVGHIAVLDPDTVSLSTLQRQIMHSTPDIGRPKAVSASESMLRINPEIHVHPVIDRLTPSNARDMLEGYDLILDCTDNHATRLLINDTCVTLGKPYVFGAVRRVEGQVFTHIPGSADYRDIFGDETRDDSDIPCAIEGVLNSVVGIIGSLQATEAVKYLAGAGDLLTDRILTMDAITMTFNTFNIEGEKEV